MEVPEGSTLAVLGPSGSGKTTLLHAVAGLVRPDSGSVWIDGELQDRVPVHRRDVALVFQEGTLFPHLSARENLAFGLRRHGIGNAEVVARVDAISNQLGLAHLLGRSPRTLSGGERQRIALGRAFVRRPRALLLDEPTHGLDADLRRDLLQWIRDLQSREPLTTILVTHDAAEAAALGDRLAVLVQGRVEQSGGVQQVLDAPASVSAARLLWAGPINQLACRPHPAPARCIAGPWSVHLPRACEPPHRPAVALLRGADLRCQSLHEGARGAVHGTIVRNVRDLCGPMAWVRVEGAAPDSMVWAAIGSEASWHPGDPVALQPRGALLYDAAGRLLGRVEGSAMMADAG